MASRFFDCGGRLLAAYGSFTSPAGVNGLLYTGAAVRDGLCSRETGTESCVVGPIENAPWCFDAPADSSDRLVGRVFTPEEGGLESSMFVVVGDVPVPGGEICGVIASTAPSFWSGAPLAVPSTASLDRVAAGVIGGECIEG